MDKTDRRFKPTQVRATPDGVVEAFLPMFEGVDAYGTTWRPGVFDAWLAENKPKIVGWDHNSERRFGVVSDWRREETGYRIFAQFYLDTADGRDGFTTVKNDVDHGSPDDWSFRFEPEEIEVVDGVTEFVRAKVYEFSPVLVGAIEGTATVGARSTAEIADAAIVDVTGSPPESDLTRALDRLHESEPEIADELAAVALLEERGLRIGKKLSAKSLAALREAVKMLSDLIEWAEGAAAVGDEDEDNGDGNNEESGDGGEERSEDDNAVRAALAILGEYSATKEG